MFSLPIWCLLHPLQFFPRCSLIEVLCAVQRNFEWHFESFQTGRFVVVLSIQRREPLVVSKYHFSPFQLFILYLLARLMWFLCRILAFQTPSQFSRPLTILLRLETSSVLHTVCLQVAYTKWLRFQRNDCGISVISDTDLLCVAFGYVAPCSPSVQWQYFSFSVNSVRIQFSIGFATWAIWSQLYLPSPHTSIYNEVVGGF